MRWKVVKFFQEIELRAWRELTGCGLALNQRQDSFPAFTSAFPLIKD